MDETDWKGPSARPPRGRSPPRGPARPAGGAARARRSCGRRSAGRCPRARARPEVIAELAARPSRDSWRRRAGGSSASSSAARPRRRWPPTGSPRPGTRTPGCTPPARRRPWSRRSPAAGWSSCSACRPARRSGSSPAPRWPTSPGSPRPGTRCCAGPAGTSRPDGLAGAPPIRVARRRRAARHDRPGAAVPRARHRRDHAGRGRRAGPDARRRAAPTALAAGTRARRSSAPRPAT